MSWELELGAALGSAVVGHDAAPRGGDICRAYRVRLADERVVFAKTRVDVPGMFAAEAHGLGWLAGGELRVPRVLGHGTSWLALEWLELGEPDHARLGRGLAQLHRRGAPSFGLHRDNFLATLPQDNTAEPDWPTFYVERRLRPLVERGVRQRRIPDVRGQLDALRTRLGPVEPPARLHGDLWWGNVAGCGGAAVVFDPAVYGGHREIDLAMLALFGQLTDRLIDAYEEIWPLAEGWRERLPLHQLYPLAAHAVMFGGSYGERFAAAMA